MYRIAKYLIAALLALAFAGCASYQPTMMSGGVLTDSAGMTLYTFDKDAANVSVQPPHLFPAPLIR